MFIFEKSSPEQVEIEKEIINSDPFFNRVSKGKDTFTTEEVLEEIEGDLKIGAERFIVKEETVPVATVGYLMENPSDKCTWLGILQIKKEYQGKGYGTRILKQVEEMLQSKQVKSYRIGVIAENDPALRFWKKQGFERVRSVINEDEKEFIIFEKALSDAALIP